MVNKLIAKLRYLLWKVLGIDYETILRKNDYTLLKDDRFTQKGEGTYDNGAVVWRWTSAPLKIGKYCSIASGVSFIVDGGYDSCSEITNYPFVNNLTREPNLTLLRDSFNQKEGIRIGNDVWIGMNTIILPGVKVGNGVSIAAGSVVTHDVPDYCLVGGIPAKLIKKKYSDENIEKLLGIAWWDWDKDTVYKRKSDFYLKLEDFIEKYYEKN